MRRAFVTRRQTRIYGKPNFKRGDGKYHIDVFAVTERVTLENQVVYHDGAWLLATNKKGAVLLYNIAFQ